MKQKRLLIAVLIVLCVVVAMASPVFAQHTLSLVAKDAVGTEKTQFARGEYFYLNINLNNAEGVAGCAFTLNYPTSVLEPPATDGDGLPVNSSDITSVFPFTQNSTPTHRENSSEAGKIYFAAAEIDPTDGGAKYSSGQITLFTVKLKVKESATTGNFNLTLTQTELFNPAAGYGTDANSNGVYDAGDTKGKVPVLVGALANTDANFGGDLSDDFPILLGDQTQALATLQLAANDVAFAAASAGITNPNSPLSGIQKVIYTGTGTYAGYGRYYQVMGTEVVDSVNCLKVNIKGHGNNSNPDADTEWYTVWLAQDTSGVVWVLQHAVSGGAPTTLGKAGAVVWAPATFTVGQRFGEIGDSYREVVETGVTVNLGTGMGSYTNCVKVKWVEGTDEDYYYVASGVGIVKEEWNDGGNTNGWELQKIISGSTRGSQLAVNFGTGKGFWNYTGSSWDMLSAEWIPVEMVSWNGGLAVNFGSGKGFWNYDGLSWVMWSYDWVPVKMRAWNGGLATDFGTGKGFWNFDGSSWAMWSADWVPDDMVSWNGGLAVNFGAGRGFWNFDGSSWAMWSADWLPADMTAWNGGIAVNFGAGKGFWNFDGSSWAMWSADWQPVSMRGWNGGLGVNFGDGKGLWNYNGTNWDRVSLDWLPVKMNEWNGGLAVDFGTGRGFWTYSGTNWDMLSAEWLPDEMQAWAGGLAVDFGTGRGFWNYTGTNWDRLSADWLPDKMQDWTP
jgi:hypothetical protein